MIDRLDNIIAVKYFLSAFVKGLMDNSKRHTIDLTPDGLSKYDMLFKNSINSSTIQLEKNLQHIMYLIQHYVFDLGYKYEYIDAIDFDSIHNGGNVPVNDLYSTQLFKDISVYKDSYKSKQISGIILNHKPVREEILNNIMIFSSVYSDIFDKFYNIPVVAHINHIKSENRSCVPFYIEEQVTQNINSEYISNRNITNPFHKESIRDYCIKLDVLDDKLVQAGLNFHVNAD